MSRPHSKYLFQRVDRWGYVWAVVLAADESSSREGPRVLWGRGFERSSMPHSNFWPLHELSQEDTELGYVQSGHNPK